MKIYTFTLGAGEEINPALNGDYIACTQAGDSFTLQPEDQDATEFEAMWALRTPELFKRVRIYSAVAQTIKLMVGRGEFKDRRASGQLAGASANNYGAVTVGTSAVLIAAADLERRSILIQNLGAAAIFVGSDNSVTTANGIKVPAGGSYTADNTTTVYAISGAAGQDVRYSEDVN